LTTKLSSTIAYIGYFTAEMPEKVALIVNGQEITYRDFYRDIGKMTVGVKNLGLQAGQTVSLEHPHFYLHWLLILACESLGITTYTYQASELAQEDKAIGNTDFVFHSPAMAPSSAKRAQVIDQDWVDGILGLAPAAAPMPHAPMPNAPIPDKTPLRIVRGSGTTGAPKRMMYTAHIQAYWLKQYQFRMGFHRQARFLVGTGFHVETYHVFATACLRMGGTCIVNPAERPADLIQKHAITHYSCIPDTLIQILSSLPDDYPKPAHLTIIAGGAPVSQAIRNQVKERLTDTLLENYGATEVSTACGMDGNGVGWVLPGVGVQVVDDTHTPLIGEAGRVRIKSDGCVDGYLDNPEATRAMFRDGWFYPGDEGIMIDDHTLKLVGRTDDLINVRGYKILPQPLEEMFMRELPVHDICVTDMPDGQGNFSVWVIFVPSQSDGFEKVKEKIQPLMPSKYGVIRLTEVDAIPRTASGKIQRNKLKKTLLDGSSA